MGNPNSKAVYIEENESIQFRGNESIRGEWYILGGRTFWKRSLKTKVSDFSETKVPIKRKYGLHQNERDGPCQVVKKPRLALLHLYLSRTRARPCDHLYALVYFPNSALSALCHRRRISPPQAALHHCPDSRGAAGCLPIPSENPPPRRWASRAPPCGAVSAQPSAGAPHGPEDGRHPVACCGLNPPSRGSGEVRLA